MIRLRLRFSVRTLVILVTLVCLYFGAWEATKRQGVPLEAFRIFKSDNGTVHKVRLLVENERSPIPLVIGRDEHKPYSKTTRCYYVWLFGPTFKLPFEKELK